MCTKNLDDMIYTFCCFMPPPENPKNQSFEKMKKNAGDIIILHMCTKNHNHEVWFLKYRVRQTEYFVIKN